MKKNWKTTLAGVFAVLPIVLHAVFPNVVTVEVQTALTSLFVALGLAAAGDAQKNQ